MLKSLRNEGKDIKIVRKRKPRNLGLISTDYPLNTRVQGYSKMESPQMNCSGKSTSSCKSQQRAGTSYSGRRQLVSVSETSCAQIQKFKKLSTSGVKQNSRMNTRFIIRIKNKRETRNGALVGATRDTLVVEKREKVHKSDSKMKKDSKIEISNALQNFDEMVREVSDSLSSQASVSSLSSSISQRTSMPNLRLPPRPEIAKRCKVINKKVESALKLAGPQTKCILSIIFDKNYEHTTSTSKIAEKENKNYMNMRKMSKGAEFRGYQNFSNKSLPRPRGAFSSQKALGSGYFGISQGSLRLNQIVKIKNNASNRG